MRNMHGRSHLDHLTPREAEVLGCLFDGLTNQQIADRLCISKMTVKTHLQVIYDVLAVKERGGFRDLVAVMLKRGLLVWNVPGHWAP